MATLAVARARLARGREKINHEFPELDCELAGR
jgi:hypothetical protein